MDSLEDVKKGEVLDYLARMRMAVLSTHALDGTIDAAAVFFLANEDLNFYFTTKIGTRKYQNMTANPRVTLTIPDTETLQTVELKGVASVVTDMKEITNRIASLINKNTFKELPWSPPIAKIDAGQYVIMRVKPTWLRHGAFLKEKPEGEYFRQIISEEKPE